MGASALMIPAAVVTMILLLNIPSSCDALTTFNPLLNNHTTSYGGKLMVGEEDMELEFMMESHISRILASSVSSQTTSTANANKASVGGCGRPPRYDSCLGEKRNNPPAPNCSTYNRANPC